MLPKETIRLLDKVSPRGGRSRFLDEAVRFYVQETARTNLRARLREGAIKKAGRNLRMAAEWFRVDEEAWHKEEKR